MLTTGHSQILGAFYTDPLLNFLTYWPIDMDTFLKQVVLGRILTVLAQVWRVGSS